MKIKKVYIIKYTDVDEHSYEYIEYINIDKVCFSTHQAASYFLLNLEFVPYSNKNGYGERIYEMDWLNQYGTWAEIEELVFIL